MHVTVEELLEVVFCAVRVDVKLWRIEPLLTRDLEMANEYIRCYAIGGLKRIRFYVMAGKHINNTRTITRQLLVEWVLAATGTHATDEELLHYYNGINVSYMVRA
jgi:hypothetical protein